MQIGNFIADAVKGMAYKHYPEQIAAGILLHRKIDDFTDNHPAVRETVRQLRPYFGRYSGILLDIYFDYLLASRFTQFSPLSLNRFAWRFYWAELCYRSYLPARFKGFMWHFICTNRLCMYASIAGIRDSLTIMVRYGRADLDVDKAVAYLVAHESELWAVFQPFFEDLLRHVRTLAYPDELPLK